MSVSSIEQTAFPVFDTEIMGHVAEIADAVSYSAEEELISQGQKDYPFHVIESGEVRIVEKCKDQERLIIKHGSGNFVGDVDLLTGRSAVVTAIACGPVSTYRLCAGRLRKLLGQCPRVSEMLLEAVQMRRKMLEESDFVGVRLIGEPAMRETSRIREFFYKNHVPHRFYEATSEEGQQQINCLEASDMPMPVVHCNGHTVGNPSLPKLAECIGISRNVDQKLFDLVIVGCGPAGLAAAVYASSEGINTLVVDSVGPGGQAGSSSRIENFIGFPSGLSGSELANRGYLQALKFGAQFIAPITVKSVETVDSGEHHLHLCTGQVARARSVLVASGVHYRQLDLPGCRALEGAGVYYAATSVEARVCQEATAVVVGGGNSAGQAAMYLADSANQVKILIRGDDLSKSMSAYLCERVDKHPKIEVMKNTEVAEITGDDSLDSIRVKNNKSGDEATIDCAALFLFIGAKPHTDWLPDSIALDEKGFVLAGAAIGGEDQWPLDRAPCEVETSVPGIMVAGDVRAGTTKRCGFAVGDGSLAVACVHRYLDALK